MATKKKMLQAAAGNAGGAGLDITEVFSTYLYDGTSASLTINNGIDLAGDDGLTWIKCRNAAEDHFLFSSLQNGSGQTLFLKSNTTGAAVATNGVSQTSTGFTVPVDGMVNQTNNNYASFTFRKAPKFFDIVQYTGNGATHRDVPHNLESAPGWVITKRLDAAYNWQVYSKASAAEYKLHRLNTTDATSVNYNPSNVNYNWTDTVFYASSYYSFADTNANGVSYVSYLFANHNSDGEFGPDSDQDIIKCGSFPWGSTSGTEVNLGFEPQWIIFKAADQAGKDWYIFDAMRGIVTGGLSGDGDAALFANTSGSENVNTWGVDLTATGFIAYGNNIASSGNIIYMAVRRGPLALPEAGTEVFKPVLATSTDAYSVGFETDFALFNKLAGLSFNTIATTRLQGGGIRLSTSTTAAEVTSNVVEFDLQDSFKQNILGSSPLVRYHWKRAPSYFDAVCYSGTGVAGRTVSHNLGVAPEMIWAKRRDAAVSWPVFHKQTGSSKRLFLNASNAEDSDTTTWNAVDPTATDFTLGTYSGANASGGNYIAYLFASLDGVSKVGSYTGTGQAGGNINVDCGFTSGARFVMIKRTDASGSWWVADTARGIVSGNEPLLALNDTSAEVTGFNMVEPYSSGFTVNGSGVGSDNSWNDAGGSYIFYAIA